jgi:hypothetical protein
MGKFMIINKKHAFLTAFFFSLSFLPAAFAMEEIKDDFSGTYVVKNVHTNTFIAYGKEFKDVESKKKCYNDDGYLINTDNIENVIGVTGHSGISKESICSIEKSIEGYSIKNHQFEGYLSIEDKTNTVIWEEKPSSNCFFQILKDKDKNKYVFKSKKFYDYLSIDQSNINNVNNNNNLVLYKNNIVPEGNKIILSKYIDDKIYFTFHPFDGNIFNIHVDKNVDKNILKYDDYGWPIDN